MPSNWRNPPRPGEKSAELESLVNFHANLASGLTGRLVNGIGAIGLTALCLGSDYMVAGH